MISPLSILHSAGSEATPIIGQTVNKVKTTERTLKVLPDTIIYDVDLTYTLPDTMTVTSAMNAIAHSVCHDIRGLSLQQRYHMTATDTLQSTGRSFICAGSKSYHKHDGH